MYCLKWYCVRPEDPTSCFATAGSSADATAKPRAGPRSWMFWKSSASSSLLEGEHDAEASSPVTHGRPKRSGAPVRSRLMQSPAVSRNIGHVSKLYITAMRKPVELQCPLKSKDCTCRSMLPTRRYSRPLSKQMEEGRFLHLGWRCGASKWAQTWRS